MVDKIEKLGIKKIAFLQALGLSIYISTVGIFMFKGGNLFPDKSIFGPIFVLTLLSVSVLICGFLSLAYPMYLFWEKKERINALKLAIWTTKWLVLFLFLVAFLAFIFR